MDNRDYKSNNIWCTVWYRILTLRRYHEDMLMIVCKNKKRKDKKEYKGKDSKLSFHFFIFLIVRKKLMVRIYWEYNSRKLV